MDVDGTYHNLGVFFDRVRPAVAPGERRQPQDRSAHEPPGNRQPVAHHQRLLRGHHLRLRGQPDAAARRSGRQGRAPSRAAGYGGCEVKKMQLLPIGLGAAALVLFAPAAGAGAGNAGQGEVVAPATGDTVQEPVAPPLDLSLRRCPGRATSTAAGPPRPVRQPASSPVGPANRDRRAQARHRGLPDPGGRAQGDRADAAGSSSRMLLGTDGKSYFVKSRPAPVRRRLVARSTRRP